jgi:hypothetical protein
MDAARFLGKMPKSRRSTQFSLEWLEATGKVAIGTVFLFGLARLIAPHDMYLGGWFGMIGIILIFHFGVFHLLSCFWRALGFDARPLMNHPMRSISLGEFWGQRWNAAFRDLTHRFFFRPLASRIGPRFGLVVGFLLSGAVHEFVISVPSRGGYGGPTLYFAIQGAGIVVERSRCGRRRIGLRSGWRGRAFTMLVLIAPLFFLFHRPFVIRVIVPFMQAVGALR